jgi:hypothetical protein
MREVTKEIRKHFIDTIAPLVVDGKTIPVYNFAVEKVPAPFVIVSTQANSTGTKQDRDWEVRTTIQIVTKTQGDYGGDALNELIVNEIYSKIDSSRPTYATTENFEIITQTVESDDPFLELYNNGRVILKTIVIFNYVSQLKEYTS